MGGGRITISTAVSERQKNFQAGQEESLTSASMPETNQVCNSQLEATATESISGADTSSCTTASLASYAQPPLTQPDPETPSSPDSCTEIQVSGLNQPSSAPESIINSEHASSAAKTDQPEHPAVERTFACISKALTTRALDIKQRLLPL